MIDTAVHVREIIADASKGSEEAVPAALLERLAQESSPITAIFDGDAAQEIYGSLQEEFGFLQVIRMTGKAPGDEARSRLIALCRWAVHQLRDWTPNGDPRGEVLIAILVTTNLFDADDIFWSSLPQDFDNPALLAALAAMMSRFGTSFTSRGVVQPPIWEKEFIEHFQTADAQQEWKTVIDLWRRIENPFLSNAFVTQIVRCLYRFAFDKVTIALEAIKSTPNTMQFLAGLSAEARFRLALATDNPYTSLSAMYLSLSSQIWAKPLSEQDTALLTQLLVKVATDSELWVKWMAAFNYYPHPNLQPALGKALGSISDAALTAYVESLHLMPIPLRGGLASIRQTVATCLSVFRMYADSDQQRLLWTLAHERWRQWRFDAANRKAHLFECARSPLDFALVGYACDCMSETEREAAIAMLFDELKCLSETWHESISDFTTAWSRLISLFQPYAHARNIVATGGDWLVLDRVYFPYDPKTEHYLVMLSGMHEVV